MIEKRKKVGRGEGRTLERVPKAEGSVDVRTLNGCCECGREVWVEAHGSVR